MSQARQWLLWSCKVATLLGNILVAAGCAGLVLGMLDILNMETFSFGLSSGVRIIGSIAIAGCLLSAIGYGVSDYVNQ